MFPSSGCVPSAPAPPPETHTVSRICDFSFQSRSLLSSPALSLPIAHFFRFGVDFDLILEALGLRKYNKLIEKVIIFKHFEVFASKPSPERENEPKRTSKDTQNTPQADPEQPRRGQE